MALSLPHLLGALLFLILNRVECLRVEVRTSSDLEAYRRYNEGVELQSSGDLRGAYESYLSSLLVLPGNLYALNNLAGVCDRLGNLSCAELYYRRLLNESQAHGDNEMHAIALNNLALQYSSRTDGKSVRFLRSVVIPMYEKALSMSPDYLEAMYNKASLLQQLGDDITAHRLLRQVLTISPQHCGANTNLGNLYLLRGMRNAAIEALTKAAQNANHDEAISAFNNLGQAYKENNQPILALKAFKEAARRSPANKLSAPHLNMLITKRLLCLWERWEEAHRDIFHAADNCDEHAQFTIPPYDALLMTDVDRIMTKCSPADIARNYRPTRSTMNEPFRFNHINRQNERKPAIAYISYDMNNHPMGFLTFGLLRNHRYDRFRVHVFSYGIDDNSTQRERIVQAVPNFVDVAFKDDVEAANIIYKAQVDVLFDLMAHTRGTRHGILINRPAPIIVNYLGYPGTSGSSHPSHFLLADHQVIALEYAKKWYTEKIFMLPVCYQSNFYTLENEFCMTSRGKKYFDHCISQAKEKQLGPDYKHSIVLANFNTRTKYEPRSFGVWLNIMLKVPNSVLWLLQPSGDDAYEVRSNLIMYAQSKGIHGSRILFAPRVSKSKHINRLKAADLFLDTFTYGAHSTASDALWSGVPLLTIHRESFQSRVGFSILKNLDLHELSVHSEKEFEDVAIRLLENEKLRFRIREKLARNIMNKSFFHSSVITNYVEKASLVMMDIFQKDYRLVYLTGNSTVAKSLIHGSNLNHIKIVEDQIAQNPRRDESFIKNALSRLIDAFPNNAKLWHLFGITQNDPLLLLPAIKLLPNNCVVYMNAAHLHRLRGEHQEAVEYFLEAMSCFHNQNDVSFCTALENLIWLSGRSDPHVQRDVYSALINSEWNIFEFCGSNDAFSYHVLEFCESLNHAGFQNLSKAMLDFALNDLIMSDSRDFKIYFKMSILYSKLGAEESSLSTSYHAVRVEHKQNYRSLGDVEEAIVLDPRKATLGVYCYEYGQTWWPKWGPQSVGSGGLGGSEEAVVFLTKEMTKWYNVIIYADPLESYYGKTIDGVIWLPYFMLDVERPPDVFVSWRYHISVALGINASKRYLWLQDMVTSLTKQIQTQISRGDIHGVFVLSKFHMQMFDNSVHDQIFITPNAISEKFFQQGENLANELIYASAPNRGLEQVLKMWPYIRSRCPNAILRIYYGFTASFKQWGKINIPDYENWYNQMLQLLQQENVVYYGLVTHEELAVAFAQAGFALYPTSFPETGCVALMKAQAMGAIPITSRYELSTLPELCGTWDLGPPGGIGKISENHTWLVEWANSVIHAVNSNDKSISLRRAKMITWARQHLLWSSVADKWHSIFSLI